jgi:hypothetical protein
MTNTPLTAQQLDAIEARAAGLYEYATGLDTAWQAEADQLAGTDVPALVAALRQQQAELAAERERYTAGLRRADEHVNAMNEELKRYADGQETPVLWSVYNAMHHRAATAEGRVTELEAAMRQIRHLHKDSPMGPCPVCIDADAAAAGGDGLVPYPCPTARLAGAKDCDPPHVRAARYEAAENAMAASLVRDGFGDDEIADMLRRPPAAGS